MPSHVHQIYYSEQTKEQNDKGFIQLDNLRNERPDWREYWPIRNFLKNNELNEKSYYGFFSPKFFSKTGLASNTVYDFIKDSENDVCIFSPFFDQSAFPINIFEQAATQHEGIYPILESAFKVINAEVDITSLVMDSTNTIFCNYFVAKKGFWEEWLRCCELIFDICEANSCELGRNLNGMTNHDGSNAPTKVFVIERIASFILATQKNWKISTFDPMLLPPMTFEYHHSPISKYKDKLFLLDALKIAFNKNKFSGYIQAINSIRSEIINDISNNQK